MNAIKGAAQTIAKSAALFAFVVGPSQAQAETAKESYSATLPGFKVGIASYVLPSLWEGGQALEEGMFSQTFSAGTSSMVGGYVKNMSSTEPRPEGWLDRTLWKDKATTDFFFGAGLYIATETARSTVPDEIGANIIGGYLHIGSDEGTVFDGMLVVGSRESARADGALLDSRGHQQVEVVLRNTVHLTDALSIGTRETLDIGNKQLPWRAAVGFELSVFL